MQFNDIKNCKILFVKVGMTTSAEPSTNTGYTEKTIIFSNYSGRSICTEGILIYTSPNWFFNGSAQANFSTGEIKIKCTQTAGWEASQFTVKRIYGLI